MNAERVNAVADAIEQHSIPRLGFNMWDYMATERRVVDHSGHRCGTTACIAGYAAVLAEPKVSRRSGMEDFFNIAKDYLGLNRYVADTLFYASGSGMNIETITVPHAVRVLRHLAKTGEVDWSVADTKAA